ncbi:MAG: PDZ domain-containing protein [Sulfurimonas sp.]|uniref:PDZ domain-containing protein n=1 Tax=Sulfurimonas sp. TaxID=2022749 RepID=UPI00260361C5|nr:PDZ domain-containing protein [Sulfurimonas sp.]MCW8894750.1 PDZ domain-containing protein [Sulfurimonas sp.]MCW8954335.1 PDZ domain-containing protein [Sulfurimonas sp.]MCW9067537.1 PDZ domain-containing protein [Sulfurimonas sp.]
MFRLFLALNFLLLNLYACKGGFEACKLKTIHSDAIVNQTLQIPVQKNQRLIFSQKPPNAKIIKHDPYLSLYLIEDKKRFKHPFRVNMKLSLGTAAVNTKTVVEGKILKRQVGLNSFATYSEPLPIPSMLLNSCCALEGIVTPRGIIEKEYINRFLTIDKVSYADIGIRVKDENRIVVVSASNVFMQDNPFEINDFILEFDGKKVKNSADFMRKVLFSKIGSTHKVKIKRADKVLSFNVKSQMRKGGGYLSDTFLEFLGISFDKNMLIVKIEKKALPYALKLGDKLLGINGVEVKNERNIADILSKNKNSLNLLFQRDQFQFFVTVN